MLPLRARVDLEAMAMKGYPGFPKSPALLKPHHQIVISRTLIRGVLLLRGDAVHSTALADWAKSSVDTKSMVYGDCQFLPYAIIRPIGIHISLSLSIYIYIYIYIIFNMSNNAGSTDSLILSCHPSLSAIALGRYTAQHPVSVQDWCTFLLVG